MSKHLLKKTSDQFVTMFLQQDNKLQWDLMTTNYNASTQLGRMRRLLVKTLNDRNHAKLRGRA